MADASHELDYARDRRRWRRRATLAALVLSALACGVVGRLLYARVAPAIANRFEAVDAQRAVDALVPGAVPFAVAIDATTLPVDDAVEADRARLQQAGQRLLAARGGGQGGYWIAALRLRNAQGRDRVLTLTLLPGGTAPVDSITLLATVASPAKLLGSDEATPTTHVVALLPYRGRFQLDAPHVDAGDPRRLLLTGTAGGSPFARELTIDANDRPRITPIDLAATRPG